MDSNPKSSVVSRKLSRWWWTLGCGFFVVHAATAFHFMHGWSHTAAFEHTAQITREMTGWDSGVGLYINEAFLCLWLFDTCQWWRNLDWPTDWAIYWSVQSVFGFMMIQATVVFGPTMWKYIACLFLIIMIRQLMARRTTPDRDGWPHK